MAVAPLKVGEKIKLPRRAVEIPVDGLVHPRPLRIWGRNEEFLQRLDTEVRKNPHEGVSVEDACALRVRLGGSGDTKKLHAFLAATMAIHTMTVYRGRVRLTTRELVERNPHEWRARRTA